MQRRLFLLDAWAATWLAGSSHTSRAADSTALTNSPKEETAQLRLLGGAAADIPYLGLDRMERADLYLPRRASAPTPAVVVIHGGGYNAGDKADVRVKEIASFLASVGYAAFSVNYRLDKPPTAGSPWPRNLMDCKIAVRWLRANAEKLGLDAGNIAALGMSAGATLAAMLAVTSGVRDLEPMSPFAGISTAVQAAVLFYPPMGDKNSARFSSGYGRKPPVTYLRPGLPPFLLLQGELDKLVPIQDTEAVAADLSRAGVENSLIVVKNEGHGFGLPPDSHLRPVVQAFLDTNLKHRR